MESCRLPMSYRCLLDGAVDRIKRHRYRWRCRFTHGNAIVKAIPAMSL